MANPERGEVPLVTATKEYILAPTMNAICEMQTALGKSYGQILAAIVTIDVVAIRYTLWTFLKKYHQKEFPTPEKVGTFIDDLPRGIHEAVEALNAVFELNAQRGKKSDEGNPQTAQT